MKKDPSENSNHIHFSDPKRAFEQLSTSSELIPELRIIGNFPVETHIISALWINMVGHKFDECLDDKSCYASRLKRTSDEDEICANEKPKKNHIASIRTFQSYLKPYNNFRRHGIEIIRNELNGDRNVIAVSLDLKSYYHTLDPMALSSEDFLNNLGLTGDKKLSQDELFFTKGVST